MSDTKQRGTPDHEFPWVETKGREITCTRCGKSDDIEEWIGFLGVHQHCKGRRISHE